jgi:hypothetical protein
VVAVEQQQLELVPVLEPELVLEPQLLGRVLPWPERHLEPQPNSED